MVVLRLLNRRQIMPTDFGPPEGQSEDEEGEGDDNDDGFDPKNVIPALSESAQARGDSTEREKDLKGAVYLRGPGKKIFLSALLQRLHERVFDVNEQASFEIRAIMRNQVYRMARAFVDKDCQYNGFKMKE
jgi:CRISPR/Cas system-associated endonuclease Cas1